MTLPRDREKWRITVVADDDRDPPLPVRVRRFLKSALRGFGLRCIWLETAPFDSPTPEPQPTKGPGDEGYETTQ